MDDRLFNLLLIGGLGLLFLILGILARLGIWRAIYAVKGSAVIMPGSLVFAIIPTGLMTLSFWLILYLPLTPETRGDLFMYICMPLLIVTAILAVWQPWWAKPKWLRWLEKEHGDIIHLLWEDVRKDSWGWERRVRNQEQMEVWVADVRRRHNLS